MDESLLISLIFELSSILIIWPIYVYLLLKWYKYRNHFVIRNRFPKISITIFICSVLAQLLTISSTSSNIYHISVIGMTISAIKDGFIVYRTYLVYIRWATFTQYYQEMMKFRSDTDVITVKPPKSNKCYTIVSKTIFIINCVAVPLLILILRLYSRDRTTQIVISLFMVQTITGIVAVFIIFKAKVRESIGCVKECVFIIIMQLILTVGSPGLKAIFPETVEVGMLSGFTANLLAGFLSLFIGIHLIHKAQRNAKKRMSQSTTKTETNIKATTSRINSLSNIDPSSNPESLPSTSNSPNNIALSSMPGVFISDNAPKMLDTISVSETTPNINESINIFLKSQENYQLFAGYLSECFALENLLFLERTIILYHTILKYKELDSQFIAKQNDKNKEEVSFENNILYEITFNYLSQIYIDMASIIENAVRLNTENDDMIYKRGIVAVIKLIYSQFCSNDAATQINISYAAHDPLQVLIERNDENILKEFDSYNKLLSIYHDAMVEVWAICQSVFAFEFKCYLKRNAK